MTCTSPCTAKPLNARANGEPLPSLTSHHAGEEGKPTQVEAPKRGHLLHGEEEPSEGRPEGGGNACGHASCHKIPLVPLHGAEKGAEVATETLLNKALITVQSNGATRGAETGTEKDAAKGDEWRKSKT